MSSVIRSFRCVFGCFSFFGSFLESITGLILKGALNFFFFIVRIYLKGRPHGRTLGYFTSYFCTCTTFSTSYTYKSTCTSTTSSNHVGFFVRCKRVRRTNVQACCIQKSLSSLAFQIKWCFYKIFTINCFIY